MIRFGTKTLLFVFVLVALWCSTFSGYAAGRDVRASVLLIIFLAAGYLAVYGRGRQRAFWSGFFLVLLLAGGNLWQGPVNKYVPNFGWRARYAADYVQFRYYAAPPVISPPTSPVYTPATPPVAVNPVPMPAPNLRDQEFRSAVNATIETLWTLSLGSIVGLIGIWVYSTIDREKREN